MSELQIDWWIALTRHDGMRTCFQWASVEKLATLIDERLDDNATEGIHPDSQTQLSKTMGWGKQTHLGRKLQGNIPANIVEHLSFCEVLRIDPQDALPAVDAWLQSALMSAHRILGLSLTLKQIEIFVSYTLRRFHEQRSNSRDWDTRFRIEQKDVECVAHAHGTTADVAEEAILAVKQQLEKL